FRECQQFLEQNSPSSPVSAAPITVPTSVESTNNGVTRNGTNGSSFSSLSNIENGGSVHTNNSFPRSYGVATTVPAAVRSPLPSATFNDSIFTPSTAPPAVPARRVYTSESNNNLNSRINAS